MHFPPTVHPLPITHALHRQKKAKRRTMRKWLTKRNSTTAAMTSSNTHCLAQAMTHHITRLVNHSSPLRPQERCRVRTASSRSSPLMNSLRKGSTICRLLRWERSTSTSLHHLHQRRQRKIQPKDANRPRATSLEERLIAQQKILTPPRKPMIQQHQRQKQLTRHAILSGPA